MQTILITDSLFVGPGEEAALRGAGYAIERLDKPCATEDELIHAIQGKTGYILGGIESVTERVIGAANDLKAIAFTGSGYTEFIPGWQLATKRGIAISAAVGGNADSVAEWALVAGLTLVRNIPALSAPGGPSFSITREFNGLTLSVVGLGNIGRALARKAIALGITVLATPSKKGVLVGAKTAGLDELLTSADVISVHVDKSRGQGVLNASAIKALRPGSVLVNAAFKHAIDNEALIERVVAGDIRAAVDYPLVAPGAPVGSIIASNAQTAFNTVEANARISARATKSLLNLLRTGDDPDLVNPEYRLHPRAGV